MRGFGGLFLATLRTFARDRRTLFWVFLVPLLLLVFLGTIFDAPRHAVIGVVDGVPDAPLGAALSDLGADGRVRIVRGRRLSELAALRLGRRVAVLDATGGRLRVHYAAADTESEWAVARVEEAIQRRHGRRDAVAIARVPLAGAGARYVDFLVPGLLALYVMTSGLYGLGYGVVMQRATGLLRRLRATPMPSFTYALAQIAARLAIEAAQVVFILAVAALLFGVRVARPGIWTALAAATLLGAGACAFIGIGLLVAARTRSMEAAGAIASAINVPMIMLGGVFFAVDDVPGPLVPIVRALPLTYLTGGLRKVMLEGATLGGVAVEVVVLACFGALTLVAAMQLFRWE